MVDRSALPTVPRTPGGISLPLSFLDANAAASPDALVLGPGLLLLFEARHSPSHRAPRLLPLPRLGEHPDPRGHQERAMEGLFATRGPFCARDDDAMGSGARLNGVTPTVRTPEHAGRGLALDFYTRMVTAR